MSFYRDTFLEINLNAVRNNLGHLLSLFPAGMRVMAVVKADSYGHGAVMIARELFDLGIRHFAVATLDEAIELRNNGLREAEILIFGVVDPENLLLCQLHGLTVSVNSLAWLKKACERNHYGPLACHLKVDSGMGRLGVTSSEEVQEAVRILQNDSHFLLRGIYSHLATAEEADEAFYLAQVRRFASMIAGVDLNGLCVHLANSAGSLKTPPPFVNMVRVGLFLNGHSPFPGPGLPFPIQPSLSLYSRFSQIKEVPAGTPIGYNRTYTTAKPAIIGTLPVGYADGYDRRLKGGRVWVDGSFHDIVGRVCMDMTMVELDHPVPEGTLAELIGPHIPLEEYCGWVGTNNYHATCAFSDRLPRVYVRDGNIVQTVNKRIHNQI